MLLVIDAKVRQGYTGWDHLLTGRECEAVVGREFRSVRDARLAAEQAMRDEADQRCRHAPVSLHVLFARSGSRWV